MDSLIFSLNATIPVFLVIVLGYILMRVGFFTEGFVKIADKYVFKVALPVLLFKQIATADIHSDFDIKFVLFCMVSTTLMFAGVWLGARLFLKDKSSVGNTRHCFYRKYIWQLRYGAAYDRVGCAALQHIFGHNSHTWCIRP